MPEKTILDALTPTNWITLAMILLSWLWSWFAVKAGTARNREDIKSLSARVSKLQDDQRAMEITQAKIETELTSMRRLLENIYNKLNS